MLRKVCLKLTLTNKIISRKIVVSRIETLYGLKVSQTKNCVKLTFQLLCYTVRCKPFSRNICDMIVPFTMTEINVPTYLFTIITSFSEMLQILRWHCRKRHNKSKSIKKRKCKWYKVPYPVTSSCKCACSS